MTFKDYFYLTESLKQRQQQFKLQDPFIKNFIARYEDKIDWSKPKSEEDIKEQIKELTIKLWDDVRRNSHTTEEDINWERQIEILQNDPNPEMQQAAALYKSDPNAAKQTIIRSINDGKQTIYRQWKNYLTPTNSIYHNNHAFQYILIKSILDIPASQTASPLPCQPAVIAQISERIQNNPSDQSRILKAYSESLKEWEIENAEESVKSGEGVWIRVPNYDEGGEESVKKLQSLSASNWCTTSHNTAKEYLELGDFWLFITDEGKARLSVRLDDRDEIAEISGDQNGVKQEVDWGLEQEILDLVEKKKFVGGEDEIKRIKRQQNRRKMRHIFDVEDPTPTTEQVIEYFAIEDYKILSDGTVEVNESFNCSSFELKKLFFEGWIMKKDFYCNGNPLTSLEGAPKYVGGDFNCGGNQLTSLEGAPKNVGGDFYCGYNKLTSLEGAPEKILGSFYCNINQLTSLEGASEYVGGNFYCEYNKLTSLEGVPEKILGSFSCVGNQLTSLESVPEYVGGDFYCGLNKLTSLEGAPEKILGNFYCNGNQLTSLEGAPEYVEGDFLCYGNQLTSLEGAPKYVGGNFNCAYNKLASLEGAPENIGGEFYYDRNKLTSSEDLGD